MTEAKNKMKTSKLAKDQHGFTIATGILMIVLIIGVYFAAKLIARMNQDNKEQASVLQDAFNDEPDPIGEDERFEEGSIDKPPVKAHQIPISDVDVLIDSLSVALTASLPGSYTGTCTAELKLPDGSNYTRFVEPIENKSKCTVTIPHAKLKAGKTWQYEFKYFTADGRTEGSYPKSQLKL